MLVFCTKNWFLGFIISLKWSYVRKYFDSENYWFYIEIKKFFFSVQFTSTLMVYLHIEGTKRALDWRKPMHKQFFFSKRNLFKEWMKFITLPTKEKRLRMNGEMITLTFFEFFSLYKKIRSILFPYLLVYLFKQRYIGSVKSCKYLITTSVMKGLKNTMH